MPKLDFEVIFKFTHKLPSLPQTTLQALQIIENPEYNITALANVIGLDQALAARVLQWANSPFYGLRFKVSTLEHAIMAMGTVAVRDLLLTISVSEMFNRKMSGYGIDRGGLWNHSVAVAAGSRRLAKMQKFSHPEQVFIAGLLHDIGKLVLNELLDYEKNWHDEWIKLQKSGIGFMELERWFTGMDHAHLGGRIAEQWGLPSILVEAIACHHEPRLATIDPAVTLWVHLADAAALMMGVGLGADGLNYELRDDLLEQYPAIDFEGLIEVEAQAVQDASGLVGGPA